MSEFVNVVVYYGSGTVRANESGVDLSEFQHVVIPLTDPEKIRISVVQNYLTVNFGFDPNLWTVRIQSLWSKDRTNICWELLPLDRTKQWVSWLASCKRRGTQPIVLVSFVPKQNNLGQGGGGPELCQSSESTMQMGVSGTQPFDQCGYETHTTGQSSQSSEAADIGEADGDEQGEECRNRWRGKTRMAWR